MEELCAEGLATHGDPESCVDDPRGRATSSEMVYEWPPRDLFPFKQELPLLSIQTQ